MNSELSVRSSRAEPAWLRGLGRLPLSVFAFVRDIARLFAECVRSLREVERREVVQQTFILGNRSLLFIGVVMGFTGAILVIQASLQAQRVLGELSLIGPAFLQLLAREFGPTIVAMMMAARYGAGIAAELGVMTVTEQTDALRMAGAELAGSLVVPRAIAGVIGLLPIAVFGTAIAFVSGGAAVHYGFGLPWESYARASMVEASDVLVGALKCLAFGIAIALVSSRAGLRAEGGAAGVGRATTAAVIASSLTVLALDLTIGALAYLVERSL